MSCQNSLNLLWELERFDEATQTPETLALIIANAGDNTRHNVREFLRLKSDPRITNDIRAALGLEPLEAEPAGLE